VIWMKDLLEDSRYTELLKQNEDELNVTTEMDFNGIRHRSVRWLYSDEHSCRTYLTVDELLEDPHLKRNVS